MMEEKVEQMEQPQRVVPGVAEAQTSGGWIGRMMTVVIFLALLVAAGYYFGLTCGRAGQAYEILFSPSRDTLCLAGQLLLAMGALAVTSGIVVVLFRPFWTCLVAFALSSAAMLIAWEISLSSGGAVLVYLVASLLYARGVIVELNDRVLFSVRPVAQSQMILLLSLAVVACASLCLGYAARIEQEGFSLPPSARDAIVRTAMMPVERRIEGQTDLTAEEKEAMLAEFRAGLESQWLGPMEEALRRYERYIPLGAAVILFQMLATASGLLSWLPILVLNGVFSLLIGLRVARLVTETREVERLTLG